MNAILIKTDLTETTIYPKNKQAFEIQEFREIVGGEIQIVYLDDKKAMVLKESMFGDLNFNIKASNILKEKALLEYGQFVKGIAIIVPIKYIN